MINKNSGNYTYKFLICDAKGNWYKLRDYAGGNNIIWIHRNVFTGEFSNETIDIEETQTDSADKNEEVRRDA